MRGLPYTVTVPHCVHNLESLIIEHKPKIYLKFKILITKKISHSSLHNKNRIIGYYKCITIL